MQWYHQEGKKSDMLERFKHLFSEEARREAESLFGLTGVPWTLLDGSHSYVYDYDQVNRNVVLKITHIMHRSANQINGFSRQSIYFLR